MHMWVAHCVSSNVRTAIASTPRAYLQKCAPVASGLCVSDSLLVSTASLQLVQRGTCTRLCAQPAGGRCSAQIEAASEVGSGAGGRRALSVGAIAGVTTSLVVLAAFVLLAAAFAVRCDDLETWRAARTSTLAACWCVSAIIISG